MNRHRFRSLVAEAIDELPERFATHLHNVEVVVDDEPSAELLDELGLQARHDTLFGLYEGIPLDERGPDDALSLPDRITLYYRPLVRACRNPVALRREIRKTLVHEIAHFFGFDDEEIEREGY
ncbi:MAG TPA: metallopeptidase family protein [Candidatus Binatia bacterium]|nr:metallopeptidase family protein [Candidatus Binatia bacterium]